MNYYELLIKLAANKTEKLFPTFDPETQKKLLELGYVRDADRISRGLDKAIENKKKRILKKGKELFGEDFEYIHHRIPKEAIYPLDNDFYIKREYIPDVVTEFEGKDLPLGRLLGETFYRWERKKFYTVTPEYTPETFKMWMHQSITGSDLLDKQGKDKLLKLLDTITPKDAELYDKLTQLHELDEAELGLDVLKKRRFY